MGYNILKQQYSTFIINKLYNFNSSVITKLYFNTNILTTYPYLSSIQFFNTILFNNNLLITFNPNYYYFIFFKFFEYKKSIFKFNKILTNKSKKFYKNILSLSKFSVYKNNFSKKSVFIHYTNHKVFNNYRKLFKNKSFNLFTPLVKIKNSRKFTIFQKKHLNKSLRFFKKDFKIKFNKRYWFLLFVSKLQKKIKIINYTSLLKNNYSKFLRINKKPQKTSIILKKQRKTYLTPKQYLFLNMYRNKVKGVKNKPIKTTLLKRILLFYKKKLFKIKYNGVSNKLTKKVFKYKLRGLINGKHVKKFFIKTLKITNNIYFSKKNFLSKKKILRSRRKYILKKKQTLTMFRYFRLFTLNKKWRNLTLYLKRSRIRFFAWRYRRVTTRNHKILRFNRFLKQNNDKNLIKFNNIILSKNLLKMINQKVILKLYRKRKWSNNFRMLINPLKKVYGMNKLTQRKDFKKIQNLVKKDKKIKKVKKFRSKFKPTHYFLKNFIKKIKKYNLKKYRSIVKYFFRVFRLNLKLFLSNSLLRLNYNVMNTNLMRGKSLNLIKNNKNNKNTIFSFKNRFLGKSIIGKRFILDKAIISQKIIKKLKKTLEGNIFKSLNKLCFIQQVSNKKLIGYNVIYYKKKNLNKILNLKVVKQFMVKVLKKFIFKPYFNDNVSYNTITGKLFIMSRYKTPLILSNLGFIFIQSIVNNVKTKLKSKINRYKYSFFYLNDIKRFFLKKPSQFKLLTSSLFFNNFNKSKFFNIKRFNCFFDNVSSNDSISKSNLLLNTSRIENFTFKGRFLYNKGFNTYFRREVRIKRIKFKPGYSRIWRNARKAINTTLNFNLKYQYRLTRELTRLSRTKNNSHIFIKELTLLNILFNSHFVTDIQLSNLLINSNVVFVNGILSNNVSLNLFKGDFIQIIVSLKYYIVYRWMLNWNKYKRTRLLKLAKVKFKKQGTIKGKQKSSNLPNWVLTSRVKAFDIPKYLEVDYFTLSTFILYEPFLLNDFNPLSIIDSRTEIFNMYNWKYIN